MRSLVVAMALPLVAHADINVASTDNAVTLTTGVEHGLVIDVGYARRVPYDLVVTADATLGWAEADPSDYRLRLGVLAPLAGRRSWRALGSLSPMLRGTHNDVAAMTSLGVDVALLAGRYRSSWFAAGELGFDWALATRIEHGREYRERIHPGATDGWYGNSGGNFRIGAQTGVAIGRCDVIARAGRLRDRSGQGPILPFYATLGVATRW